MLIKPNKMKMTCVRTFIWMRPKPIIVEKGSTLLIEKSKLRRAKQKQTLMKKTLAKLQKKIERVTNLSRPLLSSKISLHRKAKRK
jgi:hypothetical protein